jgi:predicted RNase H-like nuclease (RuvC/YqgF family)
MENFRTSNTNLYLRQSSASHDYDPVKSIAEERVEYEQRQVLIIKILKLMILLFLILCIPVVYNVFKNGSINNPCTSDSESSSFLSKVTFGIFGSDPSNACQKRTKTDVKNTEKERIETKTQVITCDKDFDSPRDKSPTSWLWNYFHVPSFGCQEYKQLQQQLENLKPSVGFFKKQMPRLNEVKAKFPFFAEPYGGAENVGPISQNDVNEVKSMFGDVLNPNRVWRDGDFTPEEGLKGSTLQELLEPKSLHNIQSVVKDLVTSEDKLKQKKQYLHDLNQEFDNLKGQKDSCVKQMIDNESKLDDLNRRLNGLIGEKEDAENRLRNNELQMKEFIDKMDFRKREPINNMNNLDKQIEELRFKVERIPKAKLEVERKELAIKKAQADIAALQDRLAKESEAVSRLESDIDSIRLKINQLKRAIEGLKVKLAMKKMKLELANSNYKIKEYLMSLIRTNNGEEADFESLVASSDKARNEIRNILKEFIKNSNGLDEEVNMTDAQLDEIIQKDQQEFDEIRRMYTELVNIIKSYGNFNAYLRQLASDIRETEEKLAADEKELAVLMGQIGLKNRAVEHSRDQVGIIKSEIAKWEDFVLQTRKFITEQTEEWQRIQSEHDDLKEKRRLFLEQHKVVLAANH